MIEICSAIGFKSTHSTWNVKELIWEWQVRCISLGVEVNVKLQPRHTKNWDKLNISSLSQTTPQKKKSKKKLLKIVPVLREKKYGKLIFIVSSRFETKLSNQNSQNPYTHTHITSPAAYITCGRRSSTHPHRSGRWKLIFQHIENMHRVLLALTATTYSLSDQIT